MLENIKMLLDLEDNSKDKLILFYIDRFTKLVLSYCNIEELNEVLEGFIEDKVINIIGPKVSPMSGQTTNNQNIKSISRGDTKIEYNVGEATSEAMNEVSLTTNDKKILNQFRKLRR